MATSTFQVTGLTCGHCANAIKDEVGALPGVTGVEVELVTGGASTLSVTSDAAITREGIEGALAEAGDAYVLQP